MNSMGGSRGGGPQDRIPKGYRAGQLHQFTPEQDQLFAEANKQAGPDSYLAKLAGGDPSMFEQMEAPAMRQFAQMQGQTASRFSGMGGTGSRKSSGFQNYMGQQSSDFAQDLAGRRQQLQRQAIMDLSNMRNQLMGQRPDERFMIEKQQKQGINWGGLAGGAVGAIGGFALGGPGGALTGAGLGYNVGSGFSGSQSQVNVPQYYGGGGGNQSMHTNMNMGSQGSYGYSQG